MSSAARLSRLTTPRAKYVFDAVEGLGACRTEHQRAKAAAFGAVATLRVPGKFHWVVRVAAERGFDARVVGYTNGAYCVATVYAFRPFPLPPPPPPRKPPSHAPLLPSPVLFPR